MPIWGPDFAQWIELLYLRVTLGAAPGAQIVVRCETCSDASNNQIGNEGDSRTVLWR